MKKKDTEQTEPQEFKLSVDEFLSEFGNAQAEIKGAFKALMSKEQINGHKMRSEWARLLELFRSQPTRLTWSEWLSQQGGN